MWDTGVDATRCWPQRRCLPAGLGEAFLPRSRSERGKGFLQRGRPVTGGGSESQRLGGPPERGPWDRFPNRAPA